MKGCVPCAAWLLTCCLLEQQRVWLCRRAAALPCCQVHVDVADETRQCLHGTRRVDVVQQRLVHLQAAAAVSGSSSVKQQQQCQAAAAVSDACARVAGRQQLVPACLLGACRHAHKHLTRM
jgi:hypothetical protein